MEVGEEPTVERNRIENSIIHFIWRKNRPQIKISGGFSVPELDCTLRKA